MFLTHWIKSGCNKSRRKRTVKTSCQTQLDISESGENRFSSVTTDCAKNAEPEPHSDLHRDVGPVKGRMEEWG